MSKANILKAGEKAPDFSAIDQNEKNITLSEFSGQTVVIYFYPKDNTPGCTVQACNLRDHYSELTKRGIQVIGVSADSASKHQKFIAKFSLPFPLHYYSNHWAAYPTHLLPTGGLLPEIIKQDIRASL